MVTITKIPRGRSHGQQLVKYKAAPKLLQDDEIEDIVGDLKYTESTKSILTSNIYTDDFTDSSPERYNSSSKETYVIDGGSDIDSDRSHDTYGLTELSEVKESDDVSSTTGRNDEIVGSETAQGRSIIAHEIYTQTSKTIIEIAEIEGLIKIADVKTLKTQTSFISITENKTVQYTIDETSNLANLPEHGVPLAAGDGDANGGVLKYLQKSTYNIKELYNRAGPAIEDKSIECTIRTDSETYLSTESDIEDDSLMEDNDKSDNGKKYDDKESKEINSDVSEQIKSEDEEIDELYAKLTATINVNLMPERQSLELTNLGTMTPLTEESKHSLIDITPQKVIQTPREKRFLDEYNDKTTSVPERNAGIQPGFKLPKIQDNSAFVKSPRLSILFPMDPPNQNSSRFQALPQIFGSRDESKFGESSTKKKWNENDFIQLPPLRVGVESRENVTTRRQVFEQRQVHRSGQKAGPSPPISIRKRIEELKYCSVLESESVSTEVDVTSVEGALTQRGGDAVCAHFLHRLHSTSWQDVSEALEELPIALDKYWRCLGEHRVTALIRQVSTHAESPRVVVACVACTTLAAILKNTNYTKKPDFYEAVTCLLAKTGSYSKPVRRAANLALDEVVCGVDVCQALAAVCAHGVTHKSALVRCAAARLVVVCCALSSAGRGLLRARPPAAAAARRHALRALAALLDDRHNDTRKYAERLYAMLRPLKNFEAYYLTDVDVDVAATQMRKYDKLLPALIATSAPSVGHHR